MTPEQFVRKWGDSTLRERQGSQSHFNDLCAVLGEPNPTDADGRGDWYTFDFGLAQAGGRKGFADVWRRGCFGWEYKGKHKDLGAALSQLQRYALALASPPYLVVSDMETIEVHTNFNNLVSRTETFGLADLLDPARRDLLASVMRGEERLKPGLDRRELTAQAAAAFGELGRRLQDRTGAPAPRAVAHFLNRVVFCLFAEAAELLPRGVFTRTVQGRSGGRRRHATACRSCLARWRPAVSSAPT